MRRSSTRKSGSAATVNPSSGSSYAYRAGKRWNGHPDPSTSLFETGSIGALDFVFTREFPLWVWLRCVCEFDQPSTGRRWRCSDSDAWVSEVIEKKMIFFCWYLVVLSMLVLRSAVLDMYMERRLFLLGCSGVLWHAFGEEAFPIMMFEDVYR